MQRNPRTKGSRWRRGLGTLLGFGALLACALSQPRLVIILVHEGLSPEALSGEVPNQQAWMLWSPTPSPAITLSTGESYPATPQMTEVRFAEEPYEGGTVRQAFQRRTGRTPPPNSLVALGAGALESHGWLKDTFASRVERYGKRGEYMRSEDSPPPSHYALMAIGSRGWVPVRTFSDTEWMRVAIVQSQADWVLVELKHWRYQDWELLIAEGIETWVVSLQPPQGFPHSARTRLTGVVRYSAREPRGLLTSASTRWAGLIRSEDLVPTWTRVLTGHWKAGAPILERRESPWHRYWNGFLLQMTAPYLTVERRSEWYGEALRRIATVWQIQNEVVPIVLGVVAVAWVLWIVGGLVVWRRGWLIGKAKAIFLSGLAVWVLFPAVSIWHGYYPLGIERILDDVPAIVGWLVGGWALLAVFMFALARRTGLSILSAGAWMVLGVMVVDLVFAGGYGTNRSLLMAGVAYGEPIYGLNDLMLGFVLGLAMVASFQPFGTRSPSGSPWQGQPERFGGYGLILLGMAYGVLLIVCGLPLLGANPLAWSALTGAFATLGFYHAQARPHYHYALVSAQSLQTRPEWVNLSTRHQRWFVAGAGIGLGLLLLALNSELNAHLSWQVQAVGWMQGIGWGAFTLAPLGWGAVAVAIGATCLCACLLGRTLVHTRAMGWGLFACIVGVLGALVVSPRGIEVATGALLMVLPWIVSRGVASQPRNLRHEGNGVYHPKPELLRVGDERTKGNP